MAPAPPPPRILDNLKQVHFNRASSATARAEAGIPPPPLLSPTRSRFASEDRIGEAQFYPGGSPTPRMSRRSEEYDRHYYQSEHAYVDEPESYADPEPTVVLQPAKKKSKWKQIFSRKKKGKGKAGAHVDPSTPTQFSTRTSSYPEPPPVVPATAPIAASDTSTRYQLRDPGPVTTRFQPTGSVLSSRAASLQASEDARAGATTADPFRYQPERAEGSFVSQQTRSIVVPEPPVMLVDEQTGNQVPREVSYISSHHPSADGVPTKKKKRSLGGTLKRLFSRKKKVPPLVIPPPEQHSQFVEIEDPHPLPPVPAPAPVQVYSTPPSAVPAVTSPRSSRSHNSILSPTPEVVVPVSPRAASPVAIPVRQGTTSSVVSSARRRDAAIPCGRVLALQLELHPNAVTLVLRLAPRPYVVVLTLLSELCLLIEVLSLRSEEHLDVGILPRQLALESYIDSIPAPHLESGGGEAQVRPSRLAPAYVPSLYLWLPRFPK
ncbi:hypothetical protein FRC07_003984 [Ceratobasidium sp. 392]|nr:hypothetical protein FRC07_003984 [Ceratobasidium sp. 392]